MHSMKRMLYHIIFLVFLFIANPVFPVEQSDIEKQTRAIASELRCVVCQNLSVADSPSELAQQMRAVIREQLQAGKSPQEIKDFFVSKYGEWVLLPHKREAARQDRFDKYTRKYGVQEFVSFNQLYSNPFIYRGKTIAVRSVFNRMISPDTGLFEDGSLLVSGLPSDLFSSRAAVVIAARVLGTINLKEHGLGGGDVVPHVKFVGVHFCQDWSCTDILPQK